MVGVDGSSTSDAAIATAFDEVSWRGPCTPGRSAAPTTGIPGIGTAAGSTSQALIRYATCPLMIVRPIES